MRVVPGRQRSSGARGFVETFDGQPGAPQPWHPDDWDIQIHSRQEGTWRTPLPLNAGQFFNKVQCFCFTQQTLKPGQGIDMAVQFYVDPALAQNADVKDVSAITLSYTFFRAANDQAPAAQKLSQLHAASPPAAN